MKFWRWFVPLHLSKTNSGVRQQSTSSRALKFSDNILPNKFNQANYVVRINRFWPMIFFFFKWIFWEHRWQLYTQNLVLLSGGGVTIFQTILELSSEKRTSNRFFNWNTNIQTAPISVSTKNRFRFRERIGDVYIFFFIVFLSQGSFRIKILISLLEEKIINFYSTFKCSVKYWKILSLKYFVIVYVLFNNKRCTNIVL